MPNEDSDATIEDQISPDENVAETAADEASTQKQPQQEQPLTREEIRKMMAEEFLPTIDSRIQSRVAKSENKTDERIAKRLQALELNKGTLKLTDEALQQARTDIIQEETMKAYQPENERETAQEESRDRGVDPIQVLNGQIAAVLKVAGVPTIPKSAPEYKEVQAAIDKAWDTDGPEGLVILQEGVMNAAKKMQKRMAAQKNNADARVLGGGGSSTNGTEYDPNKPASFYLEQATKEKQKPTR